MFKRVLIALVLTLGLATVLAPSANASFFQGYFRNDSCVGYNQCFGVGLTLYPNFNGYQVVVPANGTYRNYTSNPYPEGGDIMRVYIGPGVRCTVDMRDLNVPEPGTYGKLVWRFAEKDYNWARQFSIGAFPTNYILSIWACHWV